MKIAANVLGAQVALAKKNNAAATSMLREAVVIQDSFEVRRTARLVLSCARVAGVACC